MLRSWSPSSTGRSSCRLMSTLRTRWGAAIVLDEVRDDDRVLDMGTGSGVNGIVAASRSRDVLAVDVNPAAVTCATGQR